MFDNIFTLRNVLIIAAIWVCWIVVPPLVSNNVGDQILIAYLVLFLGLMYAFYDSAVISGELHVVLLPAFAIFIMSEYVEPGVDSLPVNMFAHAVLIVIVDIVILLSRDMIKSYMKMRR